DVEEKIATFYRQLNIDTELFERPLKGNLGVQVVRTEQSSNGFGVTADEDNEGQLVVVPTQGSSEFTEVLPSLNLALEIRDDHYLRLGAARTMARPRLDDMNASISFNFDVAKVGNTDVDNAAFSGSGGNVALEPTKSWSVDLGYEYYIGDQGYIATALYYKKLDDYIFNQSIVMDFSGVPASIEPATRLGLLSAPNNAEGGHIQGAEIATHLTGSLLSDSLAGFGIFASVSLNDGEIRETADSDPIDIPGMSKTAASATVYYEENGFQFRVSGRYRDEFLGEVSGRSQAREERIVMAETVVDAQIGFDFSTVGIEGLSMLLQANNITDEPFRTYENGDERQIKDYQVYGTNYMVGVSYTF
ncbi:MAG: TonB-dependent receptor, partial [Ferrimonas sp.]